jgi:hypothetical protein
MFLKEKSFEGFDGSDDRIGKPVYSLGDILGDILRDIQGSREEAGRIQEDD